MQVFKTLAAIFATAVFFQCGILRMDNHRPDYSAAQRNTVIVDTPGGPGSGIVIKRFGFVYVWTAYHVIASEPKVKVKQFFHFDGHKAGYVVFPATLIWFDGKNDLALLWLDAPSDFFEGVTFSPAKPPNVGDFVFHVGNWLGEDFDGSVSTGIVSQVGVQHSDSSWPWPLTDQTTATVTAGSSGGAVFNSKGEVIGIVVGGPHRGDFGFSHYIPVRVIASDKSIRWAIW